jgi:DNA-binding LacI/PurR family transcriptional regulator
MERACIKSNYEIILCSSSSPPSIAMVLPDLEFERGSVQRMIRRRVDGIICLPDPRAYSVYAEVLAEGIPLIQLFRRIPGLEAPCLGVDNERGAFDETKYLVELGHKSIGFLRYEDSSFEEINSRYQGYLKALVQYSVGLDLDRVTEPCDLSFEGGYRAGKVLLSRAPEITAVVAPTDYAALGLMRACSELGRRIPDDISIVGFDDLDIALYQALHPLTTVRQPKEEFGAKAFEMLYALIQGHSIESESLQPELVIRSSSGRPRGA